MTKPIVDQLIDITDNTRDYLQAIYLDRWNNFVTLDAFAMYYDLSKAEATIIVEVGRRVHQERTLNTRDTK